jgi:hypothetical protein
MITVNAKKTFTLLAALLMTVVAFGAVAVASESDATISITQEKISASGFKQDREGTLTIPVTVVDGEATITILENTNVIKTQTQTVESTTNSIAVNFSLPAGKHQLSIQLTNDGTTISAAYELNVAKNVWSNITTYVAIVIVAIIVVIIAVIYMRANPRNKPTTTFTELEQEKEAAKAAEPQAAPTKTEKKKYGGSEETGKIKYTSSRRK